MPGKKIKEFESEFENDYSSEEHCSISDESDIIEGDYEIEEYSECYEPFEYLFSKKYKSVFPKPMLFLNNKLNSLDEIFIAKNKTIFKIPDNFKRQDNVNKENIKNKHRLCMSLLLSKPCSFGSSCIFAHTYNMLKKCKYDFCKKTKLIGPGTFISMKDNICYAKHNLETLDSYIFRIREKTVFDIKISIYKEFLDSLKIYLKKNSLNVKCLQVIIC